MTKTKIIASINQHNYQKNLKEMIISGIQAVYLDRHYSDYSFISSIITEVNQINKELNKTVSTILDLNTPCICTGKFKNKQAQFKTNDRIRMHMNPIIGSEFSFSVNYPDLIKYLKTHSIIKLNSGKVILEVSEIGMDYVVCEVIEGGFVKENSKIYLPDTKIKREYLTNETKEDIIFASKMNIDYLVISDIVNEEDIQKVNDMLIDLKNDHISVLTKINNEMLDNIDKIINICEGIVVSPNELLITSSIEKIATIQKNIISKAFDKEKIIIIEQDLSEPIKISEVVEISNNISLGIDSIIINHNISNIKKIIQSIETDQDYQKFLRKNQKNDIKTINEAIISNAVYDAISLDCRAIILITQYKYTAKQISKFRPKCEVLALVPNETVAKNLNILFGIIPVVIDNYNFDNLVLEAKIIVQKILELKSNDKIIIIGEEKNHQNFIKIEEI